MMRLAMLCVVALACFSTASADVIITEIMYNPRSPEGRIPDRNNPDDEGDPVRTEWVEIHNTGDEPVDMTGWYLADEDGQTTGLPEGTFLGPGQTAVLIPVECTVEEFREAWGEGFPVWQLGRWGKGGLNNLANSPSATNEILELRNAAGEAVDIVNYDDEGDWPSDVPDGPSIYLVRAAFDPIANDDGTNWRRSAVGIDGARKCKITEHFTGQDIGSPGTVPPKLEPIQPAQMPTE